MEGHDNIQKELTNLCLSLKKFEAIFSVDDLATEILSRLPAKDVAVSRCVSKRWNGLTSSPSFLRVHSQRSEDTSGLFFQEEEVFSEEEEVFSEEEEVFSEEEEDDEGITTLTVTYICASDEKPVLQNTLLDFLPEKVVIMASCNGLLCCRSSLYYKDVAVKKRRGSYRSVTLSPAKELLVYVCNPTTKEWISLRPAGCATGDTTFGLAFYPFGNSVNWSPFFKLVSIQHCASNSYTFAVYSSETRKWTISKEVCHCNYRILKNREVFVGGRFHWLTRNHHIIAFDVERELSGVIKLPGLVLEGEGKYGICLGNSEGYFHYVCANSIEVRVWLLKEYSEPVWVLKHSLNLVEFGMEYFDILGPHRLADFKRIQQQPETKSNNRFVPFAFHEEVLFFNSYRSLYSYNFKTKKLRKHCFTIPLEGYITSLPTVLPYSVCLAAMRILNEELSYLSESKGNQNDSSSQRRSKRKPKKILNRCSTLCYSDHVNSSTHD